MKIKEINIYELGKFNKFNFTFHDDITFIYGANEAGKSTIFEAIKASISGFSSIKDYKYIPIGSDSAWVSSIFDSFSVERKLSKNVVGYMHSSSNTTKINNKPIYNIDREIIKDIYTIDSDDILSVSDKSVDALIESILFDSNLKKYNSIKDMSSNILKKRKALYSKRSGSNKEINLIESKINTIEDEIFEYNKKEFDYKDKKNKCEKKLKDLNSKNVSKKKIIDDNKSMQSDLLAEIGLLEKKLNRYDDYINDSYSCIDLHYSLHPFILALISTIVFVIFSKPILAILPFLVYLVYKFAYFSKAIRFRKILFMGQKTFGKIKDIQSQINSKKHLLNQVVLNENSFYENFDNSYESKLVYELSSVDDDINFLHASIDINLLKQKLKNLKAKRNQLVSDYNRYLLLENLYDYSKATYLSEFVDGILTKASDYMESFTNGAYNKILKSDEGYLIKGSDKFQKEEKYLSRATKSQLYLALRLALADYFDQDDTKPMFFDDAFVHFDKFRLDSTIRFLIEYSKYRQIIVFTSKKYDILGERYETIN